MMDICSILIPTVSSANTSLPNLWNMASTKRCQGYSFSLWAQRGNITNLTSWTCFMLSHTFEGTEEQEQHGHSEQGDSEQQDCPQAPFTANTKLQQHCLLARQPLNSPNAPASLTLTNLSPTHPDSVSSSWSGRSSNQDAEALGNPLKILLYRE